MKPRAALPFFVAAVASSIVAAADNARILPEGLSTSDWSSIRAAYEAHRHATLAVDGGYQARNPGQQWRTRFDGRGFTTTPDAGGWSWGLELMSYGRQHSSGERGTDASRSSNASPVQTLEQPRETSSCGRRIEYAWDEALTEWYVNDGRGLEHGFTIHVRPSSALRAAREHQDRIPVTEATGNPRSPHGWNGCLQFTLAVRGSLRPQVSGDGRGVVFVNEAGAAVVSYGGLTVFDAHGETVPASFDANHPNPQSEIPIPHFITLVVDDRDAVYPLTIDPIAHQAYLKASNTGSSDQFGISVAVSGDTVVVGAPGESSNATGVNGNQADDSAANSGAAYVFVRNGTSWNQQAYLKGSNTNAGDLFGINVAVSSDTIAIGASREDSHATGVDGDHADNSATDSGAAYIFTRSGGVWSQQAYLKASNTGAGDEFGSRVAASGDTAVIGASGEDSSATGVDGSQTDNSAPESGATYVFARIGSVWSQQAYLKASNTGRDDRFGVSTDISGETIVVGAWQEDSNATGVNGNEADNTAFNSGAAYVFVRNGGIWSQQAYLKASNSAGGDSFGGVVRVSGETVVVGAAGEDSNALGVNGNQVDNSANSAGAAYVFVRTGGVWSQQAYLKASNTGTNDWFGARVSIYGDTVVIAALFEDSSATGVGGNQFDNSAADSGAAYVFSRNGTTWTQQAYLKASNTGAGDNFGVSVALSGNTVVVGANLEASSATGINGNQADNIATNAGAAYVFRLRSDRDVSPAAYSPE